MENKPTTKNTTGRYRPKYRGVRCLNCSHPLDLSDKYCPSCSQANSTKKLTVKDFFEEFFSNILSYDSKLLQTLSALVLRPGKITTEYIAGKRLSYTNPFRFLLSLAIIYFLLMGYDSQLESLNQYGSESQAPVLQLKNQLEKLEFENENEKEQALAVFDSIRTNRFNAGELSIKDSTILDNPQKYFQRIERERSVDRYWDKIDFFETVIKKDTVYNFENVADKYKISKVTENKMTFNLADSLIKIKKRPGTFFSSVISKLPFATFFFLPFFSAFVWLIYIRKKYTYTDHLIFSFHNQSLLFILLTVSYLVSTLSSIESEGLFLLLFAVYLYKAMRNFYRQGRVKTIVKYLFLNTIFVLLSILGIIILIAGSIFTY